MNEDVFLKVVGYACLYKAGERRVGDIVTDDISITLIRKRYPRKLIRWLKEKNFPFCSDGMVTFGRAIRLGQMSTFTNDFEKLTGRKPLTVREIFEDLDNHLIGQRTSKDN